MIDYLFWLFASALAILITLSSDVQQIFIFKFWLFTSALSILIILSSDIQNIFNFHIQLIYFYGYLFFLFLVALLLAQKMIIREKIFAPFIFLLQNYQHKLIMTFYAEIYFLTTRKIFYSSFTTILIFKILFQ